MKHVKAESEVKEQGGAGPGPAILALVQVPYGHALALSRFLPPKSTRDSMVTKRMVVAS